MIGNIESQPKEQPPHSCPAISFQHKGAFREVVLNGTSVLQNPAESDSQHHQYANSQWNRAASPDLGVWSWKPTRILLYSMLIHPSILGHGSWPSFAKQKTVHGNKTSGQNKWAMKLSKVTEGTVIPVWSVKSSSCLFSHGNQRPGKTPCRWKHNLAIIPPAAIENPLIYLDDIMSYSCSPALLSLFGGEREGGRRFPLSCTTTVFISSSCLIL